MKSHVFYMTISKLYIMYGTSLTFQQYLELLIKNQTTFKLSITEIEDIKEYLEKIEKISDSSVEEEELFYFISDRMYNRRYNPPKPKSGLMQIMEPEACNTIIIGMLLETITVIPFSEYKQSNGISLPPNMEYLNDLLGPCQIYCIPDDCSCCS
jgi:hypothetical protein